MRPIIASTLITLPFFLTACESAGPALSARRNIEVVYRFENLRKQGPTDDWAQVKAIVDRHTTTTASVRTLDKRTAGPIELSTYEAKCTLANVRELEAMQLDLEKLYDHQMPSGDRLDLRLQSVTMRYKSNFISAAALIRISGVSVQGNTIRLYPGDAPSVQTVAGPGGFFSAELTSIPESQWVYGVSEDPAKALDPKYFRIHVSTRTQEYVTPAEFNRLYPQASTPTPLAPAGTNTKPPAPSSTRKPTEEQLLQKERDAEAKALEKERQREDEHYRKSLGKD